MNRLITALFLIWLVPAALTAAEHAGSHDFGIGLQAGDPSGLTIKYWTGMETAIDGYIGGSYFGSPRIGVDWLWHFPLRETRIVRFYAGLGPTIGFGNGHGILYTYDNGAFYYRSGNGAGIGVRGVGGVAVEPRNVPIEVYFDLGLLLGVTPNFGSALEGALGIRFYP